LKCVRFTEYNQNISVGITYVLCYYSDVFHIYCTQCTEASEYETKSGAKRNGWTKIETKGVVGVSTAEANGLCPICTDKK